MAETQRRPVPREDRDELTTGLAFLQFARESVAMKLDGVDDERARWSPLPTGTTLLGLVKHLTDAERYWCGRVLRGDDVPEPDWSWAVPAGRSVADVLAAYAAAARDSDAALRERGLDAPTARPVDDVPLQGRWVLAHLLTETTRHAGHADVVRELLDGTTGR